MFVQSTFASTLPDVANVDDIRAVSHLALNSKLGELLSSVNGESEEREVNGTYGSISSHPTSFSQVMASLKTSTGSDGGTLQQKVIAPFSSVLNGDYLSSFKIENPTPADKVAEPSGMAARGVYKEYSPEGDEHIRTIDKTSVLYEKALELESYFVKIMMQSMRATLSGKTLIGEESFASKMYKDMMYDELNRTVTKNAGFGLADHIYLQLNRENSNN